MLTRKLKTGDYVMVNDEGMLVRAWPTSAAQGVVMENSDGQTARVAFNNIPHVADCLVAQIPPGTLEVDYDGEEEIVDFADCL